MAQIFPKWANQTPLALGAVAAAFGLAAAGFASYYFSPEYTDVGYQPKQPVPYSHALHAGELGLDCRFCHASVELSPIASVPATEVCMNCHHIVKRDSPVLAAIQKSASSGEPMRWVRVHKVPEYAYFDHSAHLAAGVGCASCHGPIHQMDVVRQVEPLSMAWCLECHRNPDNHLRALGEITDMDWQPPANQAELAARFKQDRALSPPEDCSGCHH
ncbi:MAG: cytochrome c family protein [Acidobacteriota bacterium]|nr:cytochrome c family protein [Acidobacteriota bacterium]